jgi:hypothetical protein
MKYLDKEDIESLGFTFYKNEDSVMMFHSEELNLILGYFYNTNKIATATKDPSKNEIFSKTGRDPNIITQLKIKNKSELQKLLQQLEIPQNKN